jgi:hypothetical protein
MLKFSKKKKFELQKIVKENILFSHSKRHCLDFSLVFSASLTCLKETCFQQAGSLKKERT